MFKTYIRISPIEDCVDIYFVEISPGLDRMITAVAKPMELQFERVGEGFAPMQPSLRIPGRESVQFLKSIAEALDQNGTKTDDDHKIAGTLEATKFHLDDLRQLLKLKKQEPHDETHSSQTPRR